MKAAIKLTVDNPVLKENNMEVGVIIADNDSSSMCTIRNASSNEVLKQSDINHSSGGVVKELYRIKKTCLDLMKMVKSRLRKANW